MPTPDYKDILVEQPIEGVPVLQAGKSYYALDMTGAVWTRSEEDGYNDDKIVTVTCTFPSGAVYTQVGTLETDSYGTKTYTMTSQSFEEDS